MDRHSECISNLNEETHQKHPKHRKLKIDKKIVRIEYPGIIQNTDRALDTLGGINKIEKVRIK